MWGKNRNLGGSNAIHANEVRRHTNMPSALTRGKFRRATNDKVITNPNGTLNLYAARMVAKSYKPITKVVDAKGRTGQFQGMKVMLDSGELVDAAGFKVVFG